MKKNDMVLALLEISSEEVEIISREVWDTDNTLDLRILST